jgi:hypothetical protein
VSSSVYRVTWRPGSDELLGVCHCGAEHLADDPIELWTWLFGHPLGHDQMPAAHPQPVGTGVRR